MLAPIPSETINQRFTFLDSIYEPVSSHRSIQEIEFLLFDPRSKDNAMAVRNAGKLISLYGGVIHPLSLARLLAGKGVEPTPLHKRAQEVAQQFTKAQRKEQARFLLEYSDLGKDSLDALKAAIKESLPSVIFSGIIPKGSNKRIGSITGHTGCFVIDLDHIAPAKLLHAREILKRDPATILVFTSPSGDGIKAVFVTDFARNAYTGEALRDAHRKAAKLVIAHVETLLSAVGILADCSGVDPNRHCFLPYDSNVYAAYEAEPLALGIEQIERAVEQGKQGREKAAIALELAKENITLHDASYALERARSLADERYVDYEDIVSGSGYSRHDYLFKYFGNYCSRFGIPIEIVLEYGQTEFAELWNRDRLRAIHLAYEAGQNSFGTWGKQKAAPANQYANPIGPLPRWMAAYTPELLAQFEDGKKLSLKGPTGSGKTNAALGPEGWLQKKVASDPGSVGRFFVPIKALAQQAEQDFQHTTLYGETDLGKALRARTDSIVVSTYHQAEKTLPDDLNTVHAVIDETHVFFESAYMDSGHFEVCKRLFDKLNSFKSVTLISATPPPYLDVFGFKTYAPELPQLNKVDIDIRTYDGSQLQTIVSEIKQEVKAERLDLSKHQIWIRINHKLKGRTLAKRLQSILPEGRKVIQIESKTESPEYSYLKQTGLLPNDVAICIVTKLLDVGVNVRSESVERVYYFDPQAKNQYPNPRDFKQFVARFRELEVVPVVHFTQSRKGGEKFDGRKLLLAYIERARADIDRIKALRDIHGELRDSGTRYALRQAQDEAKGIRILPDGRLVPDFLELWRMVDRQTIASYSTGEYFTAVREGNDNFVFIGSACESSVQFDSELAELEMSDQAAQDQADTVVSELLTGPEKADVLSAYYHSTTDKSVRQEIREELGIRGKPLASMRSEQIKEQHRSNFDNASSRPITQYRALGRANFSPEQVGNIWKVLSSDQHIYNLKRLSGSVEIARDKVRKLTEAQAALPEAQSDDRRATLSKRIERYQDAPDALRAAENALATEKAKGQSMNVSNERFFRFESELQTLTLSELGRTKLGRESIGEFAGFGEVSRMKAITYRAFMRELRNWRNRTYTKQQIEDFYTKARGSADPKKRRKSEIGEGMTRFKELFEYEVIREGSGENLKVFYKAVNEKSVTDFCHRFGFDFYDWLGEKRPQPAKNGDSDNRGTKATTPINNTYRSKQKLTVRDRIPQGLTAASDQFALVPPHTPTFAIEDAPF